MPKLLISFLSMARIPASKTSVVEAAGGGRGEDRSGSECLRNSGSLPA
jgi:hypothetical protein